MTEQLKLAQLVGVHLDRHQLWIAAGILDGFDRIFRSEPAHRKRQLAIGRGLDGSPVNTLHIFGSACAAAVYSHKKLRVGHVFLSGLRTKLVKAEAAFDSCQLLRTAITPGRSVEIRWADLVPQT